MYKRHKQFKSNVFNEIERLQEHLATLEKDSDEYPVTIEHISNLYALLDKESISMETVATIAANLVGMLLVINHERAGIIASKAFGLIRKIA